MRIQCPDCAARYEVPDDRLQPGRTVRCARCGHDWAPVPAVAVLPPEPPTVSEPVPAAPPLPAEEARPRPPHPFLGLPRSTSDVPVPLPTSSPPERPGRSGLAIAWVLSILVLVAAGWAALAFRGPIAAAWPPSLRVYDALGLSTPAG